MRGTIFWFRRRVPVPLTDRIGRGEIVRSLRTSCPREAARRARAVWLATDRVFSLVANRKSLEREQVDLLLRRLVEESVWDSSSTEELLERYRKGEVASLDQLFGETGAEAILAVPEPDQGTVLRHLSRILEKVDMVNKGDAVRAAQMEAEVANLRRWTAEAELVRLEGRRIDDLRSTASRMFGRAEEPKRAPPPSMPPPPKVEEISQEAPQARRETTGSAAKASKKAPRFSELWPGFLAEKGQSHDDHQGYSANTAKQSDATLGLFLDLIGDKPLDQYTGMDAGEFRKLLLRLPHSHGKGRAPKTGPRRVSARDEIGRADARQSEIAQRNAMLPAGAKREGDVQRLKMKTVKRHFSTLKQYFDYLAPLGFVDKNIFSGFKYPGTRSGKRKRDAWSEEDLGTLLRSDWFARPDGRKDYRWMTAIAMFSGMRVEEIARLRCVDVQEADGITFFDIAEQPDGWTPKTEAGVRKVPVHPFLLESGFMRHFEAQRASGSYRLFPGLVPHGPDGKLSGSFSREFSRQKVKLGIGPKTVFHSFRHSVRTMLTNKPAMVVRDAWIDAVMGHAADERRGDGNPEKARPSTGELVYNKRTSLQNLFAVVREIDYTDEVDLAPLRASLAE